MSRRFPALGRDDGQLDARARAVRAWDGAGLRPRWLGCHYPDDEYARVNYTWGRIVGALKAYAESGSRPRSSGNAASDLGSWLADAAC